MDPCLTARRQNICNDVHDRALNPKRVNDDNCPTGAWQLSEMLSFGGYVDD